MRLSLVVAGLLTGALPGALHGAERIRPGVFLYAAPGLPDPNFAESVVLLLEHNDDGSLGVIINRPTKIPPREVVPELGDLKDQGVILHWGGPVQPGAVMALLRSGVGRRVITGVHLGNDVDELKRAALRPDAPTRVRIYAGYAGWTAGQLAEEVRRDTWVIGPADAASVFSADPEFLWRRVHQLIRRQEVRRPPALPDGGAELDSEAIIDGPGMCTEGEQPWRSRKSTTTCSSSARSSP
jgi:putative transcriptional regulator